MRRLTDIGMRTLKPRAARYEHADGGGLYIVVQPSGKKSYAIRYRFAGRTRKLTLSGALTLAAARKIAADTLYEVELGNDPARRRATTPSLQDVCEEFFRRDGAKLRSRSKWQRTLNRLLFPELGGKPVDKIGRAEIVSLLDRIEDSNGAVTADLVLACLRRVLNWHATRSDSFRSPIVRGMSRAGKRSRDRTLSDAELRTVWKAADASEAPYCRLIQFLLLTAARRQEAAAMTHNEIADRAWVLPAERSKPKLEIVRPLSTLAQQVLARTPRIADSEYVFTIDGRKPIGGFAHFKREFDKVTGPMAPWRLHDLRRTARSLMSRAGVSSDHAERCLGHVIGGVRDVYDRYEFYQEKAQAYESLAALIRRICLSAP
ncbi:MAG TPA: site-specific integrase [Xanthobacteraceae bacterium]|jgi:hypothetical protein